MPWWESKAYIMRVGDDYTLYYNNDKEEILNFNSAHNFKICTEYVEKDT